MLQLTNNTDLKAEMALFQDKDGVDTLYVMVKATFDIKPQLKLSEEQLPIGEEDVYWGEPGESSLRYSSDYHIGKASTDIILSGHAYAPKGEPTRYCECGIKVGNIQMRVAVFGNRQWKNGEITQAEPFTIMPLTYENAYGGTYSYEKTNEQGETEIITEAEECNPVGKGFIGKRKPEYCEEISLPNLEDPDHLIQTLKDTPTPMCFSFVAPSWLPRRQYAGTYDDNWIKTQAPYLPADFDHRFFNMSHPRLNPQQYLQGGEPVTIINVSPEGRLDFKIPYCPLQVEFNKDDKLETPALNLETVLIELDENRFSVVWRTSLRCDKQALKVKTIEVNYRNKKQASKAKAGEAA